MPAGEISRRDSSRIADEDVQRVADAFDAVAEVFDTDLENEITLRLRKKIYSIVESFVTRGSVIWDINCGTGIDAIYFAHNGYRVAGSDVSEKMIAIARGKGVSRGADMPKFFVSSFDNLNPGLFCSADLVFSNFGGLNCTRSLSTVAASVARITRQGGYFVGVIMPPFSLWETISFISRLRFGDALRRSRIQSPATGFLKQSFPVYYHAPASIARAFSTEFIARKIIGLSIVSPTPQSTGFTKRHPGLSRFLAHMDTWFEHLPVFRSIGDHYIIILQKSR